MMGWFALNAMCVSLVFFLGVTNCSQMASYLLTFRSNTCTLPSAVTAANTVEEYGAQATSPTALFKSKVNTGSLWKEQTKHTIEQMGLNG